MDSLTQFALGAAVGAAVLGRRLGPRRAVLVGGVLGTLPDLDVLYPFDDPVDTFVLHRAATHSLIVQAAATPLIGEILVRLFAPLRERRLHVWFAVYACLATHALLDATTVYGTYLFWPVSRQPAGLGSIFIIDPLYTLPLIVAVVWALCLGAWTARFRRVLATALVLSTAYLGWTVAAQQIAASRAAAALAQGGIVPERLLATPTPLNSLLWRAIAVDGASYYNVYVPMLGSRDAMTVYRHRRLAAEAFCLDGNGAADRLVRFTHGYFRVDAKDDGVVMSDLRMGLTPNYAFRFVVADADGGAVAPRRARAPRQAPGDLDWLLASLGGEEKVRPAEAAARIDPADPPPIEAEVSRPCGAR